MNDRDKARLRAGYGPPGTAGAQDKPKSEGSGSKYNPNPIQLELEEDAKSIRVQMRNKAKEEESRSATQASALMTSNINAPPTSSAKDMKSVDEWMGKPQKMTLDIIDTQKFAEIVRQKHGLKEKEKEEKKQALPSTPPAPTLRSVRDERDRDDPKKYGDSRKGDLRMEISSAGRGRDRDRLGRDNARDRRRYD
jgi:hypothetical protein